LTTAALAAQSADGGRVVLVVVAGTVEGVVVGGTVVEVVGANVAEVVSGC
jgi:hemolysin activation/secretion protein